MSKIAIVGDIHTNIERLRQFINDHPEVECIVGVGDLALFASKMAMYQDKKAVKHTGDIMIKYMEAFENNTFERFSKPIYMVKGNHDDYINLHSALFKAKNIHYLQQAEVKTFGDTKIAVLGGIFSPIRSNMRTEELAGRERRFFTYQEINSLKNKGAVDILITHQCAAGILPTIPSKDSVGKPYTPKEEGSKALQELLAHVMPKYYICGHHHKNFQTNYNGTSVIGLGNFGKNEESYIIFDTTTKEVI